MVCFSCFLRYHCACQIFADEVRFYSSRIEIFLAKRMNSPRLSSMYFSGQVPFLPSLSLKFLCWWRQEPWASTFPFSLLQEGFFWKVLPLKSALVLLLCLSSRSASFGWFCSHVLRSFCCQIRPAFPSLWGCYPRCQGGCSWSYFPGSWSLEIEPGHARVHWEAYCQ
jgi:hypothetical protein